MIVGCYTMDLYCDAPGHEGQTFESGRTIVFGANREWIDLSDTFTGRNERECMRQAHAYGWRFRKGKAFCPFCTSAAASL